VTVVLRGNPVGTLVIPMTVLVEQHRHENAVLRGVHREPLRLGRQVLVGPTSCLTGCQVDDEVFLATGSRVFNGASIGNAQRDPPALRPFHPFG
jgi:carbonic anhydrase/acetyltransferase-like protein (isoleucine patch superfamily)